MPPDTTWSDQYNKRGIKLSSAGAEWKNFMKECLFETEIFKKSDLDLLNEKCFTLDQNIKIDTRHKMVKNHDLIKTFPTPKEQIQTEARKFLRDESHKKLQKQKECRIVTKEIERFKHLLENYRKSSEKDLKEITTEKVKHMTKPKLGGRYKRLWKRLESYEGYCEIDEWMNLSVQRTMETHTNPEGTSFAVKVYVTKKEEETPRDSTSQPVSWNRKGSITTDGDIELNTNPWESSEKTGKDEIMKRYLETISIPPKVIQKKHTTITTIQDTEIPQNNPTRKVKPETPTTLQDTTQVQVQINEFIKKRKLQRMWNAWRAYTIEMKQRKHTRTKYQLKIEKFLTKLQESQKVVKTHKLKEALKIQKSKKRILTQDDIYRKQMKFIQNNERKEKKQQEILKEVITSQKESNERLLKIKKRHKGVLKDVSTEMDIQDSDKKLPNFLLRMEKRREERSNRWKDIKERRKQMEEERERCEKQKQEERNMLEEVEKRKKLEEIKQKRKAERKKKEKEKLEKEKLKNQTKLAEMSYQRLLVRSYGWIPWRNLIKKRIRQEQEANNFRDMKLMLNTFRCLKIEVKNKIQKRMEQALELNKRKLLKNHFYIWMDVCQERKNQLQVAVDWNELKITETFFKTWMVFLEKEQFRIFEKEEIADRNYEKNLKKKYFKVWKNFPELKRQEIAKEERKRIWRQKVQEILPDYRPIHLFSNHEDLTNNNIITY